MEEVDLKLKNLNLEKDAPKQQMFIVIESMGGMPPGPVGVFDSTEKAFEGMKVLAEKVEKETFADNGDAEEYGWVYLASKKNALLRVKRSIIKAGKHSFAQLQNDDNLHDYKLELQTNLYLNVV